MAKVKNGWLTPSDFGESMPVTSPLYPRGPYYYRDCRSLTFIYQTDEEACLSRMPAELELVEPATAVLVIAENFCTVGGTCNDAYMGFMCKYKGEPMVFSAILYEDKEAPAAIGREIYGYPKKHCEKIEFSSLGAGEVRATVDLLEGHRLLTATMRPSQIEPAEFHVNLPMVMLKIVPDAEGSKTPSLAQLVKSRFDTTPMVGQDGTAEIFTGPGQVHFDQPSDIAVPVRQMVSASVMRFNAYFPYGEILKTY